MDHEELIAEIDSGHFYQTSVWKEKRREILARDHYECQRCRRLTHRIRRANTVHHIQHLDVRPDLALDDGNLISLCESCHNDVHPEKLKKTQPKPSIWQDEKW